jgi:hypothetical protein
MTMRQFAWIAVAAAALAAATSACSGGGDFRDDTPGPKPSDRIELTRDVDPGPGPWDQPDGQAGGSVDWFAISTEEGMTFLGGALVVDKIRRHYSEGVFGVDVRVRNTTSKAIEGLYVIEFRSPTHEVILGQKREYHPFFAAPHGYAVLTNSALTTGAIGFRLFIRGRAPENRGNPDPKNP